MTTIVRTSSAESNRFAAWTTWLVGRFETIPYWLIAVTCRIALAQVFWSSAQTKLASWDTTLSLFEDEYALPLLPPELAAHIALTVELVVPVLLLLGLATRFASLIIFGMTLVIEIFVYPAAWPTHIQWAAMMLVLMAYGAGPLSLDWLVRRWTGAPSTDANRP